MSAAATHELASPLRTESELPGMFHDERKQEAREALECILELMAATTPALAVAVVLLDGDIERSVATWGLAAYANSTQAGVSPLVLNIANTLTVSGAQLKSEGVCLPLEQDWTSWTFNLRRLHSRWGNHVGVIWIAREHEHPFSQHDVALFEKSTGLIERELGFLARQEDIIIQRERATVEVAQLHEQLHKQHSLYRELVKHLPDTAVVVFDSELRVRLNEGWQPLTSRIQESTLGTGQYVAQCFLPEEASRVESVCRRALVGNHASLEMRVGERTLEVSVGPLRDAANLTSFGIVVARDVTEARRKHEQSMAIGARLQVLVQSLDDGILVEDENRRIQVCSNRLCEIMR